MALKSVVEVAVHFGNLRNVDLFHQGLYHVRARLLKEQNGWHQAAEPSMLPSDEGDSGGPLWPAAVDQQASSFRSKTVLIRYCGEELTLNDVVSFRCEEADDIKGPLSLELELMFADVTRYGIESFTPESDPAQRSEVELYQFRQVATASLRLHRVEEGLHAYCPVTFDEFHFCCIGLMVHASLVNYRLRIKPLRRPKAPLVELAAATLGGRTPSAASNALPPDQATSALAVAMMEAAESAGGGLPLACLSDAADSLQQSHLQKLAAAHEKLVSFLQHLAKAQVPPLRRDPPVLRYRQEAADKPVPLSKQGRFNSGTPTAGEVAKALMEELNFASTQLLRVWSSLLMEVTTSLSDTTATLAKEWRRDSAARWTESMYHQVRPPSAIKESEQQFLWSVHARLAKSLRRKEEYRSVPPPQLEDTSAAPPRSVHPILFEQRYSPKAASASPSSSQCYMPGRWIPESNPEPAEGQSPRPPLDDAKHVFVLVHGFHGHSYDMRLLKANLELLYPESIILCSSANEEDTEGDIGRMGSKLADEVKGFIKDWCPGVPPDATLGRLSFITHSMGGLIARSALPLLSEYSGQMYTFLSLSSPHLGHVYTTNSLFSAGLWLAKQIRGACSLEQLSMADFKAQPAGAVPAAGGSVGSLSNVEAGAPSGQEEAQDEAWDAVDPSGSRPRQLRRSIKPSETIWGPEACFLSNLSRKEGLAAFQHVALVSSYQDQYTPFESARIEMCSQAKEDPKLGPTYARMVKAVLGRIEPERLIRLDISFNIAETNLDTMIGRAAHLQFIESQPLMQMLLLSYPELFESSDS